MKIEPCPTKTELLQYLSDELQSSTSSRVAAHIATCADCESATAALCSDAELRDLAESLKRMQHVGQSVAAVAAPPALVERLYRLPLPAGDTGIADLAATAEYRPGEKVRPAASGSSEGTSNPVEPEKLLSSIVFGQYQLTRELGHGGMGVVYEGAHVSLKRRFAVKLLLSDRMDSGESVERFHREMEAIGQLDHPNIVRATDAGEIDGIPFLAMEFVDGVDLSRIVAKVGPLSVTDTCEVLCQAASGLQHVHDNGLVHRDIKPSNLLLTTTDQVKIVDLGLARLTQGERSAGELTETGIMMGTIDYMSPEQAMNTRDAGPRADQYSLACVLYFLLTGRPVFACESIVKTILAHRDQPIPSLCENRSDVPESLDQVFQRMMSKEPQDRYESLLDVIREVQEIANSGVTRFSDNLRSAVPELQAEQRASSTNESLSKLEKRTRNSRDTASVALQETMTTNDPELSPTVIQDSPAVAESKASQKRLPRRRVKTGLAFVAAAAFASIIYVNTGEGQLVVSVEQSDLTITIDGDPLAKLTISTKGKITTINLPAGSHTLEISRDGAAPETQQFRVFRNETVKLKAGLQSVVENPQRELAESIVSRGGSVLISSDGDDQKVTDVSKLPNRMYVIKHVYLQNLHDSAEFVEKVAGLSNLEYLDIQNSDISDNDLKLLVNSDRLRNLVLKNTKISNAALSHIARIKSLERLNLSHTAITDDVMSELGHLPNLSGLFIPGTAITDEGIKNLCQNAPPRFQEITLSTTKITDNAIVELQKLGTISSLSLLSTNITDACVDELVKFKRLKFLEIRRTNLSTASLNRLKEALPDCEIRE